VERKRLVLDANILIRGCLGVRVRNLIADYADRVDFFVAEANVAEAAGYIADLAREKNLDEVLCAEALLSLMRVVQLVEDTALESARAEALARILDADDWPALERLACNWSAPFGRRTKTSLPAVSPRGRLARWRST